MKSAEEPEGKGGCLVCCAREVLCAKCINRATEPTRKELKKLKRRRDALYERLSSGVQAQVCYGVKFVNVLLCRDCKWRDTQEVIV